MKIGTLKAGLIACGVLWSFSGVLVKRLDSLGVTDPFLVAAFRSAVGVAFLLPLLAHCFSIKNLGILFGAAAHPELKAAGVPGFSWRAIFYCGAFAYTTNILLLVWVFQHTNATNAVFLHYGGLLLISLVSRPLLKQTPSRTDYISLALFFGGMAVLVYDGFRVHEILPTIGGVVCGITFAIMQLSLAKLSQWDQELKLPISLGLQNQLLADLLTALIGIGAMLSRGTEVPHSMQAWLALILIGVVAWGLPNVLFIIFIRINPLLDALLLGLGDPLFTAIWPIIFGYDALRAGPVIGGGIIFCALVLKAAVPRHT